jgi:hypothetical protein
MIPYHCRTYYPFPLSVTGDLRQIICHSSRPMIYFSLSSVNGTVLIKNVALVGFKDKSVS